jgi:hypothetical protein
MSVEELKEHKKQLTEI